MEALILSNCALPAHSSRGLLHRSLLPYPCTSSLLSPLFLGAKSSCKSGGRRRRSWRCVRASKNGGDDKISFGDRLLDYIEGGPKLRKWYGAPDQLPKDGGGSPRVEDDEEELIEEEEEEDRDAVLVTDAESETGQLLVLALILKRLRVRALVRDAKAATAAFGPYVEPVVGDVSDATSLKKALRGVRAVICSSKVGALADKTVIAGLQHIVFMSQLAANRNDVGFAALFKGNGRRLAEQDEAAIATTGVPYTIVRPGALRDEPGGILGIEFVQDGIVTGSISREDAATICVRALNKPPQQALIFEVANKEEAGDWKTAFSELRETTRSLS